MSPYPPSVLVLPLKYCNCFLSASDEHMEFDWRITGPIDQGYRRWSAGETLNEEHGEKSSSQHASRFKILSGISWLHQQGQGLEKGKEQRGGHQSLAAHLSHWKVIVRWDGMRGGQHSGWREVHVEYLRAMQRQAFQLCPWYEQGKLCLWANFISEKHDKV